MVKVPGYQIQQLLSWGAQGDVFLGLSDAGECVALKLVSDDRADSDPQSRHRLAREAKLLSVIDSPHVVKLRGFEQGPDWSCLVLEYLDGQRLDTAVRTRGGIAVPTGPDPDEPTAIVGSPREPAPPPPAEVPAALRTEAHVAWALDLAQQLARGLAELHRIRLVHRDVKPQNVILVGERAVLIDFGFARMGGLSTLTQTGAAIGTLAYMAPELLRGQTAGERSDVYSLGATIHYCLTGSTQHPGDTLDLSSLAARGRPTSVRKRNPAVRRSFANVVARCLEPDPRDRYADASEVLADLERCARGESVRLPFSPGRLWRHHRRTGTWTGALAALLLAASWLFAGFDAGDTAATILAAAEDRPGTARNAWQTCDDGQRAEVTSVLNERLGADAALALAVAKALHLGLLRVQPRANHLVALARSNGEDAAPALPSAAFLSVDAERNLLVRPGRAWFLVRAAAQRKSWGEDDPHCLQLLLQVDEPTGEIPARSLAPLPTDDRNVAPLPDLSWIHFAAHRAPADGQPTPGAPATLHADAPFSWNATEVPVTTLQYFRRFMANDAGRREVLDGWLRHPDEPQEVADRLWAMWEDARDDASRQPAQMGFWEAHRLASCLGCRLPTVAEWRIANNDGGKLPGPAGGLRPHQPLQPVDAEPAWDRTQRGLRFANSNVREWTISRKDGNDELRFVAVPTTARGPERKYFFTPSLLVGEFPDLPEGVNDMNDPNGRPGLRLCRTRLPGP